MVNLPGSNIVKVKELGCQDMGCTACCQWGEFATDLKPDPTLLSAENGDCTNLKRGQGCVLHGTDLQPVACRKFDCRDLLIQLMDNPIIRVVVAAIRLQAYQAAKNPKQEKIQ